MTAQLPADDRPVVGWDSTLTDLEHRLIAPLEETTAWVEPTLGEIPEEFLDRARILLARQQELEHELRRQLADVEAQLQQSRRRRATQRRQRAGTNDPIPAYLDLNI